MVRIAIITDIHEDVVSLKKALRMIGIEKCDSVICLGDLLGYPYLRGKYEDTRNASECIRLVRMNCSLVLPGNHDLFHVRKIPEYCSGFSFPPDWYELSPEDKHRLSNGRIWNYSDDYPVPLSEGEQEFFLQLPEFAWKHFGEKKVLFSHYLYPNFSGFHNLNGDEAKGMNEHFGFMREEQGDISICGHMHIEGIGMYYEPGDHFLSQILGGFSYYSFGERKLKNKRCCVTIPALADNGQVNGFAIYDSSAQSIQAISLNTNRRFIL